MCPVTVILTWAPCWLSKELLLSLHFSLWVLGEAPSPASAGLVQQPALGVCQRCRWQPLVLLLAIATCLAASPTGAPEALCSCWEACKITLLGEPDIQKNVCELDQQKIGQLPPSAENSTLLAVSCLLFSYLTEIKCSVQSWQQHLF